MTGMLLFFTRTENPHDLLVPAAIATSTNCLTAKIGKSEKNLPFGTIVSRLVISGS